MFAKYFRRGLDRRDPPGILRRAGDRGSRTRRSSTRRRGPSTWSTTTTAPRSPIPTAGSRTRTRDEATAWVEAQNEVTFAYLESLPRATAFEERLTELWDYAKMAHPVARGRTATSSTKNDGLQNQSVLFVQDGATASRASLLDPNTLSRGRHRRPRRDGDQPTTAKHDGLLGERQRQRLAHLARARTSTPARICRDVIAECKFSGAAWAGGHGLLLQPLRRAATKATKLKDANYCQKLYYHKLGTRRTRGPAGLRASRPEGSGASAATVTETAATWSSTCGRARARSNRLFYKDLADTEGEVVELLAEFDARYTFIGNDGPIFYFQTDLDAPKPASSPSTSRTPAARTGSR